MPSEKMELVITNPQEDGFLRHIDWNFEEIKGAVEKMMKDYQNLVYTEDSMKQAKEDRAKLNKFKKVIEDRRKEVKKKLEEPYKVFESEVKEVVALIEEPAELIDKQIKEYEAQQKKEKKEKLRKVYEECIGDLTEQLPFEKFFEERYLNQTVKLKTATEDIQSKARRAETDLQTIERTVNERFQVNAKDVYFRTLDLSSALTEAARLEEMERKLREEQERREVERKRREEEAKAAEAARKAEEEARQARLEEQQRAEDVSLPWSEAPKQERVPAEQESVQERTESVQNPAENAQERTESVQEAKGIAQAAADPESAKIVKARFYAVGTLDQLRALTAFMKENGIRYGKLS